MKTNAIILAERVGLSPGTCRTNYLRREPLYFQSS